MAPFFIQAELNQLLRERPFVHCLDKTTAEFLVCTVECAEYLTGEFSVQQSTVLCGLC